MTKETLSLIKQARRIRILDAAESVFRADGFRGASMERIAVAAGMSKVTVYGYFPDKEAAFVGVAQRFAERLQLAFEAALAAKANIAQRITQALLSKHLAVLETVRRSTQSQDIFATRDRIAAPIFAEVDQRMMKRLTDVLRTGGVPEPKRLARLLFAAAQGIANQGGTAQAVTADIELLVQALLSPTPARSSYRVK
jgi:AcrR family transcriptional regulator